MAGSAMASANEFLLLLNASCGPCADLGPPPDAILRIPPPPLPSFLQRAPPPPPPPSVVGAAAVAKGVAEEVLSAAAAAGAGLNASDGGALGADAGSTCSAQCEWGVAGPGGVQYVELPRQGPAAGDTWLLVLIASSAGVLLLGALLALLLLKCRVQRAGKAALHVEPSGAALRHAKGSGGGASASAASGFTGGGGGVGAAACASAASSSAGAPCAALGLYPGGGGGRRVSSHHRTAAAHGDPCADGRVLWAALTPRGTTRHHFARPPLSSASAPRAPSPLYEAPIYEPPPLGLPLPPPPRGASFDSGAYVEEAAGGLAAAALAGAGAYGGGGGESFPLAERCSPAPPPRPRVSSPTRIEHPNLPPLNLIPTLPRPRRGAPNGSVPATLPGAHTLGPHPPQAAPVVL